MRPTLRLLLGGLASLLFALAVPAEPLAVVGKNQTLTRATAANVSPTAANAAFVAAYFKDRAASTSYAATLPIENPPEWGKTLSAQTGGKVEYLKAFPGGFVCRISLHGLAPEHEYILTLNGNPEKSGNALLAEPVSGLPDERFYDFLFVKSDAKGEFIGEYGIALPIGAYDVRLYVKDTSDFKIVLYRDFFRFSVQ